MCSRKCIRGLSHSTRCQFMYPSQTHRSRWSRPFRPAGRVISGLVAGVALVALSPLGPQQALATCGDYVMVGAHANGPIENLIADALLPAGYDNRFGYDNRLPLGAPPLGPSGPGCHGPECHRHNPAPAAPQPSVRNGSSDQYVFLGAGRLDKAASFARAVSCAWVHTSDGFPLRIDRPPRHGR